MIYRKATFADVEAIYELVADYAEQGVMLARSRNTLYETLRDMVVAVIWDRLAEVRTMAVSPDKRRRGIGAEIVKRLLEDGEQLGIEKYFTLTYQPEFFKSLGFVVINKEELPHKVWKECIDCPKFPNCDEIAMVKV